MDTYGPTFIWFAWHPTYTQDQGWRWLRNVWKRRVFPDNRNMDSVVLTPYFETSVLHFTLGVSASD